MRSSSRPVLLSVVCAAVLCGTRVRCGRCWRDGAAFGAALFGAAPSAGAGLSVGSGRRSALPPIRAGSRLRWVWPTGHGWSSARGRRRPPTTPPATAASTSPPPSGRTASAVDGRHRGVRRRGRRPHRRDDRPRRRTGQHARLGDAPGRRRGRGRAGRRRRAVSRSGTVRRRHRACTSVLGSTVATSTRCRTCRRRVAGAAARVGLARVTEPTGASEADRKRRDDVGAASGARVRRPVDLAQPRRRHVRVDLRRAEARVPEEFLHRAQVRSPVEQVRRRGVPEGVRPLGPSPGRSPSNRATTRYALRTPSRAPRSPRNSAVLAGARRPCGEGGPSALEPRLERVARRNAERHHAFLAALAEHPHGQASAVDVGRRRSRRVR